ncbi:MAG: putative sulfate exporter family transporter [Pirellulales bacterium]|nr:putative sulfate exporter family transporter [Pirellulales bacterium]
MDVPSESGEIGSTAGAAKKYWPALLATEDLWSIWLGWIVLLAALAAVWLARPADQPQRLADFARLQDRLETLERDPAAEAEEVKALRHDVSRLNQQMATNPFDRWFANLSSWDDNPLDAFVGKGGTSLLPGLLAVFVVSLVLFGGGVAGMGTPARGFPLAFACVFLLAVGAYVLAGQKVVKHYNLEYALWALVVGLVISNTLGTPRFLLPALRTEFYIKTGLVLLGAEILFHRLLTLGLPGVFIAWGVTPVVLISTYLFGQHVLRIPSRSLNMVISADMSVCGVSAAIATAAACRAKKEELSLAIGLSLVFTVAMMVIMPAVIVRMGIGPVLGGAWIGGTIDSTGAVAAAGGMLGESALAVAATVKMIQNILIGAIAFGVSVYWVTRVERDADGTRPSLFEIWYRFPKFILGFVAASIVFTFVGNSGVEGDAIAEAATSTSKTFRNWFFCLAFVSIGLETSFRELSKFLVGGKPLILYVCGQTLNLILTLFMAWLMFEKVFPDAASALGQ